VRLADKRFVHCSNLEGNRSSERADQSWSSCSEQFGGRDRTTLTGNSILFQFLPTDGRKALTILGYFLLKMNLINKTLLF
jgi:hypothetical protein